MEYYENDGGAHAKNRGSARKKSRYVSRRRDVEKVFELFSLSSFITDSTTDSNDCDSDCKKALGKAPLRAISPRDSTRAYVCRFVRLKKKKEARKHFFALYVGVKRKTERRLVISTRKAVIHTQKKYVTYFAPLSVNIRRERSIGAARKRYRRVRVRKRETHTGRLLPSVKSIRATGCGKSPRCKDRTEVGEREQDDKVVVAVVVVVAEEWRMAERRR